MVGFVQLEKCCSQRCLSRRLDSRKDAGAHFLSSFSPLTQTASRIVEFATTEEAQRAVKELSETVVLGRPVYLREVM